MAANTNFDALSASTQRYYTQDKFEDCVFEGVPLLKLLKARKGVHRDWNGGEKIVVPTMEGTNSTVQSYEQYEEIDTTAQDGMTAAFYEWRELAGTIAISRREERQNSGEAQIMALLEQKVKQAEMSIREEVNAQLLRGTVSGATFVPGNSGKDLNPLGWFLRKDNTTDPTTGGNVGNIAGATSTWWRHHTAVIDSGSTDTGNDFALAVTTYAGLKVAIRRLYNYCGRGSGGFPNLLIGDQVSYETYENALDVNIRFQNTKMADLGFDSIKVRGAEFIWDELVPDIDNGTAAITAGTIFFLNTNFYKLVIDSETDFVTTPFVEPENQTAKIAKVLFMANSTVNNMRKHGVLYAISQSIVA